MSVEAVRTQLSGDYFMAGSLVFNLGLVSENDAQGFLLGQQDPLTAQLRKMDAHDLTRRGITFERDMFAPVGTFQGTIFTPHYETTITTDTDVLTVTRDFDDQRYMSAQISGHYTDPKVLSVGVRDFRPGHKREYAIGSGKAAQRIGANVLARAVADFRSRIAAPLPLTRS